MDLVDYLTAVATRLKAAQDAGDAAEYIRLLKVLRDTVTEIIPKLEAEHVAL
jgi:hypothetical protein